MNIHPEAAKRGDMRPENERVIDKARQRELRATIILLTAVLCVIGTLTGCGASWTVTSADIDYKAVLLDNGRAYFGRLLERTTDYLLLKDVFLIEREMMQEWGGKTVRVILVKGENGREPQDHMFINAGHILAVMPVSAKLEK